jgi:hypothetical protein
LLRWWSNITTPLPENQHWSFWSQLGMDHGRDRFTGGCRGHAPLLALAKYSCKLGGGGFLIKSIFCFGKAIDCAVYCTLAVFSAEFLWNCALLWWLGKFTSVNQS